MFYGVKGSFFWGVVWGVNEGGGGKTLGGEVIGGGGDSLGGIFI